MKMLRSLVLLTSLSLVFLGSIAQGKIGYISLNELITAMPEYKKAVTDMNDYQQALNAQSIEYQNEAAEKDSIFKADSLQWNAATKEVKKKEITDLYKKFLSFNQQLQTLLNQKEQDLIGPIQQKAASTTQIVAKENGYAYVFAKEHLIAYPQGDDLLPLVLKKLNIQVAPKEPGK